MKLNKAKLVEAAKAGIERQKQAQEEWDLAVENARLAHELHWREELFPKWLLLAEKISDAAHITEEDMPRIGARGDYRSRIAFYVPFNSGRMKPWGSNASWQDATHSLGPRPVYEVRNLENLLSFLEAVEDETVTTAALERVGFRNLAKLTDAVRNGHWDET